jgi:hypothetical protein
MEDVAAPPPECAHRFKKVDDGVLECKLCGFRMAPRPHKPAEPTPEIDCSRGAEFMKRQQRRDSFFSRIADLFRWWVP